MFLEEDHGSKDDVDSDVLKNQIDPNVTGNPASAVAKTTNAELKCQVALPVGCPSKEAKNRKQISLASTSL